MRAAAAYGSFVHSGDERQIEARFDEAGVCVWSSDPGVVPVGARVEQPFIVMDRDAALAQLEHVLTGSPRTGKEVAIALCEIDHFAPDDPAADGPVGVVGLRVRSALRHGDVVARWDSGRLLLLLRGIHHLRGAIRVANKVRVAVEQGGDGRTVCVGVTMVIHGESPQAVLARVGEALTDARDTASNFVSSSPRI